MGSILSLSANPVIARILIDLDLIHEEVGHVIMSSTVVDDLVGWTLFAVILAEFAPDGGVRVNALQIVAMVAVFFVLMLGPVRWLAPRLLDLSARVLPVPAGVLGVVLVLILLSAAGAEKLGIHSFPGAFLCGIALAETEGRWGRAYEMLNQVILAFFAPIYFLSMGLNADFVRGLDVPLALVIIAVAFVSKIGGVYLGARLGGMSARPALAVGSGMNSRGAIGIILASTALEAKIIDQRLSK